MIDQQRLLSLQDEALRKGMKNTLLNPPISLFLIQNWLREEKYIEVYVTTFDTVNEILGFTWHLNVLMAFPAIRSQGEGNTQDYYETLAEGLLEGLKLI